MKIKYLASFGLLLLMAIYTISCSSLQLVSSWKSQSAPRQTGKKILVVFNTKRLTNKMIGEEAMVQVLRDLGYKADLSGSLLGSPATYPDEESLNKAVAKLGYDAILNVVETSEKTTTYIPGTTYYAPVGGFGGYYHFYNYYYAPRQTAGHMEVDYRIFYETSLYDISKSGGNQLLYTSTSESFDSNTSALDATLCKVITKDMVKKGIL